jgi:hypothetical protein
MLRLTYFTARNALFCSLPRKAETKGRPMDTHVSALFEYLYPQIEGIVRQWWHWLEGQERRDEAVQETLCYVWLRWRAALARGKDPQPYLVRFVVFCCRHVRHGRRFCGQKLNETLASAIPGGRRTGVQSLPQTSTGLETRDRDPLDDVTSENPAARAAFNVDYPAWLDTLTDRDERIACVLTQGERTKAAARYFRLSPARICHKRTSLKASWEAFTA